ncbi:MAG: peptidylprolyl isomerase [Candidatus Acidiferrum sp.]
MRLVLSAIGLLACAMAASAQNPVGSSSVTNSSAINSNRQTIRRPAKAEKKSSAPVELPPDTPVVTLNGVCDPATKSESKDCKTVLTQAQMDAIVKLMAPNTPQSSRQQLAISYVRMLAASKLANDRKLEDNPVVAAELEKQGQVGRMQVLAKAFYRQIEEDAGSPTTAELQQYYAQHQSDFEEGEVWRLSIPESAVSATGQHIDRSILKAEMDGLRSRAVTGYDFDQLQQLAYKDLGINTTPPPTKLTMARRDSMPPDQAGVFDLEPGVVTPVIESYTRLVILKLVSKRSAPLESVLPEIKEVLKRARLQQEIRNASKSVTADFNLQYFGLPAQPPLFTLSAMQSFAQAAVMSGPRNRTVSRRRTAPNPLVTKGQPQAESHP